MEGVWVPNENLVAISKKVPIRTACTLRVTTRQWKDVLSDSRMAGIFRQNKICIEPTHGAYIKNGNLWMWGGNYVLRNLLSNPIEHIDIYSKIIHKIVLGRFCALALTEDKELYVWGDHKHFVCLNYNPSLFVKERFVDVCIGSDDSFAGVSVEGGLYFWNGQSNKTLKNFHIPETRIRKCFFAPWIFGFTTETGVIYLANYGMDVRVPSFEDDFMMVDWKETLDFQIKTVMHWKQSHGAIVLSTNDVLYLIPIGCDGEIVGAVKKLHENVVKAIYRIDCDIHTVYFLTRDGTLGYRQRPHLNKGKMLGYGNVFVDFDVTLLDDHHHRIDAIDAKGDIKQFMVDLALH